MAIGNPLEIFQWGQGGQKLSPQQVAEQRRVAQALAARGGAPRNVGEGLNRIGEALLYRSMTGQADEAEAAGRATANQAFESLFGTSDPVDVASGGVREGSPTIQELFGLVGNEWASPQQSAVAQALLNQQLQQQDPAYQQQLALGEIQLDQARNPFQAQPLSPEDMAAWGIPEGSGAWAYDESGTPQQIFEPQAASTDLPTSVQEYEYYVQQAAAAGEQPVPYVEWDNARKSAGGISVDARNMGTIPPGYRVDYDEAGNPVSMSPIPGGPAEAEALAAQGQAEAQAGSDIVSSANALSDVRSVRDIIQNSDTPVTGTLSVPFAQFSGTPAGRVRSYVGTLQSNVALGAMQRLKEASATGATGFGALSAPELNLLINDIGALNPDTTEPEIFLETLDRIERNARAVVEDIKRNVSPERIQELGLQPLIDTFESEGAQSQANPSVMQSVQAPQAGTVEDGYRFKGGDPADPNNWERVQ